MYTSAKFVDKTLLQKSGILFKSIDFSLNMIAFASVFFRAQSCSIIKPCTPSLVMKKMRGMVGPPCRVNLFFQGYSE